MSSYRLERVEPFGNRVRLHLAGRDEPLEVSSETVYEHRLVDNIVLTPSQLAILEKESAGFLCRYQAGRYLVQRDHSVGELVAKLRRKQFPSEAVDAAVEHYRMMGVLDDQRVALALAERLLADRPCGATYLVAWLRRKRFERELAERVADLALGSNDETERAAAALRKRWSRFAQLELEASRQRAYTYLARRGFGYEAARRAFEQVRTSQNED